LSLLRGKQNAAGASLPTAECVVILRGRRLKFDIVASSDEIARGAGRRLIQQKQVSRKWAYLP
jgi:hypothetical protein